MDDALEVFDVLMTRGSADAGTEGVHEQVPPRAHAAFLDSTPALRGR
jgi:hypothetical protein